MPLAADAVAVRVSPRTRFILSTSARLSSSLRYRALLESRDYVTRRQAARLLGQLLCDRANVKAMML